MKIKSFLAALAVTTLLSACATQGQDNAWGMGNKQTVGALGGAVVGGILGSKVGGGSGAKWATGAGALLGALAGSSIGQSLDQSDRMYHEQAFQRAYNAPLNQQITWNNPQNGNSGTITPVKDGRLADGSACRQYKQTIVVDGRAETAYGTACRNGDGTWTLQN